MFKQYDKATHVHFY